MHLRALSFKALMLSLAVRLAPAGPECRELGFKFESRNLSCGGLVIRGRRVYVTSNWAFIASKPFTRLQPKPSKPHTQSP